MSEQELSLKIAELEQQIVSLKRELQKSRMTIMKLRQQQHNDYDSLPYEEDERR